MMQDEIVDKIKKSQKWASSRYEIDHDLIEAGHNPVDIDTAWDSLAKQNQKHPRGFLRRAFKSYKFWLIAMNITLGFLALASSNLIPYYWFRLFSPFSLLVMALIVLLTWLLVGSVMESKVIKKMTITWIICIIFLGGWGLVTGGWWVSVQRLETPIGSYYLLVKQENEYDPDVEVEIHHCQFADILCSRIKKAEFGNSNDDDYTKKNRLEIVEQENPYNIIILRYGVEFI